MEDQGYTRLFSGGHGTVINGRYLLTHNHFKLPLLFANMGLVGLIAILNPAEEERRVEPEVQMEPATS